MSQEHSCQPQTLMVRHISVTLMSNGQNKIGQYALSVYFLANCKNIFLPRLHHIFSSLDLPLPYQLISYKPIKVGVFHSIVKFSTPFPKAELKGMRICRRHVYAACISRVHFYYLIRIRQITNPGNDIIIFVVNLRAAAPTEL